MALETALTPSVFDDTIPNLSMPEADWTEDMYKRAIRGFSRFYNTRGSIFDTNQATQPRLNEVENMRENFSYLAGKQRNKDYAFMATDGVTRQEDALSITPGQKLAQIVEWMRGRFHELVHSMQPAAESVSEEFKSMEAAMFDKGMLQYMLKPYMSEIQNMGVDFLPGGPSFSPEVPEDVYEWMDKTVREKFQSVSEAIAQDILYTNDFRNLFLRAATHILANGRCGIDACMVNGDMKLTHIPSWQLIIDRAHDDDLLRKARFKGYLYHMTPSELFSRWSFDATEKENIQKLASGQEINYGQQTITYEMINQGWANLNWFQRKNGNIMDIGIVRVYWKSQMDLNYKSRKDKYDNIRLRRPDYKTRFSDYTYEGWRQGVLIANMWLRDAGPVPNKVGAVNKNIEDDCPLRIFMPNMNMGENVSITERLKKHQDRIDAWRRKVTDLVAQSGGKGVIINGAAFGLKSGEKIVADLKRDGVSVVNLVGGEPGDDVFQRFAIPVDLTTDPNISMYIELMREEERNMEELANVPKIAQGLQQGYVGAGVQDRTLQQSNLGTATTYYGFVDYLNSLLQYSTNVAKFAKTTNGEEKRIKLKVGDIGFKWMTLTKDVRLEDVMVYFKIEDVIDDAAKQRIRAYAQGFSQNPEWGVDPLDILKLEKARTWNQMIATLEYSLKRKDREKKQQQAMAMILDQANKERAAQQQMAQEQLRSMTSRANTAENVQGKVVTQAMQQNPELAGGAPPTNETSQPQAD